MFRILALCLLLAPPAAHAHAQGVIEPLGIQGIEQQELASVRARGMGGVFAAVPGSPESVVLNPAGLAHVERPSVAIAGHWKSRSWAETQHWNPNRYYAGLSLFFSDPDDYTTEPLKNPGWTHSQQSMQLASALGVYPVQLNGRSLVFGVGFHLVAHLGDFDRNNNVLDPYIGQFRPEPVHRPNPGEEITVHWSAFERERLGHLNALVTSAGYELARNLTIGLRVAHTWGSTSDRQEITHRGLFILREAAHDYSHEPGSGTLAWSGTSSFSSLESTVGMQWQIGVLSLGATWQLPTTVTREVEYQKTGQLEQSPVEGMVTTSTQEIEVPTRFVLGVALQPARSWLMAFDYVRQDYSALSANGYTPDWGLVQGIGLGLEWHIRSTTVIRVGYREDPQPFRITGSGLLGETARGEGYSAGISQQLRRLQVHVSYELQHLRYHDRWESNVDYNKIDKHNVLVGATYAF